jgi:hypothetical protein
MTEQPAIPPPPGEVPLPRTSTMAIVSLILGALSWVMIPGVGAIAAVITGHLAKKEIRESGGWLTGDGLATGGLVLGYVQLALSVIGVCFLVVLAALGIALPALCLPFSNQYDSVLGALIGG